MKKIAFFDFDGTITTHDTLLEFIKFCKGTTLFYIGFLLYSPYLIAFKLKLIPNQKAKEKILSFFFRGMTYEKFSSYCHQFSEKCIPPLLRPGALEEIKRLQHQDFEVVIVSASPENWIEDWAKSMNIKLIASRLIVQNGVLTGQLMGKNCHGNEKVERILKNYNLSDYSEIYAFGDSSGDKPMLELAQIAHYKPFRS